jgi:hypothetical protein
VIAYTRGLSLFITPFLLAAFVLLYIFPGHTAQLFAWTIKSTMTSMVLASAYLGGAYFFVRVLGERHWHVVAAGFPPVTLFAGLLAVATVQHWDVFNHQNFAFWLWTGLYFTAPFLVLAAWLVNRRHATRAGPSELLIGQAARLLVALVGLLALVQGLVMSLAPTAVIPHWPWPLTPLTCRVVGAVFCLGVAGLLVLADPRWAAVRLMLQVEVLMVALMLLAAVRARAQIDTGMALTWLLLAGFVGVLIGSAALWLRYERGGGSSTPNPETASRSRT